MPPKTKTKKKGGNVKSSSMVDGLSTEEMSKDQLEEHIIRLREELDREREERSYLQVERDKIRSFWEISKRNLEELEADLRIKSREREEAEERHRVEITVYKQKLKHVLSEHHFAISELKMDAVASSSLVKRKHVQSELDLHEDTQGLQAALTETRLNNQSCIKELKLKHQVELMELTNDYERRFREIEVKNHRKMEMMVEAEKKKCQVEVAELEDRMKRHTTTLMEVQDRALREAEEYYSTLQSKLLTDLKTLKEELAEAQKQQAQTSKKLLTAQRENRRLTEALQEAQQKRPQLQKQLEEHKQARARLVASRAQAKVTEKELMDLTVEHDLLLQAFEKVQQERDELLKKQRDAIVYVQQTSATKEVLLERKLAALTETLEKKEAQLCAALSASNADPTAGGSAANRLEEIMEQKQVALSALQEDLERRCEEYDELLNTCRERLETQGVALHDLPFRTAQQILKGPPPKK